MKINYEVSDCLEYESTSELYVTPHVCNDIGGWGSGFVVAISNKFKHVENAYRKWNADGGISQFGLNIPFSLGNVQMVQAKKGVVIANMIAQHQTIRTNGKPIRYLHLANCMNYVGKFCKNYTNKTGIPCVIRCPMFGSALAGGNWDFISELIQEIWIDGLNIPVTVCVLKEEDLPE